MSAARIAVLIPTMRRPDSLARAVRSVLTLAETPKLVREIVVADNSPEASARATVGALQAEAATPILYVHVPTPGVATARNAALGATTAPLIAFLDDDEEAEAGWLSRLLQAHERFGADVTFGPIHGRIDDQGHWARAYLERLFGREGPATSGPSERAWGCGNSMMTRASALPGPTPFETAADQVGGEDDVLFAGLRSRGGRFAWAADAWVTEHAPAHRATLAYALRRAFAFGQSPCQDAARRGDVLGVAKWMAVGAGQAAVFGAAAGALTLVGSPRRAEMLDRTVRGLGKVFWTRRFEPQLYGAAELRRSDAEAARVALQAASPRASARPA